MNDFEKFDLVFEERRQFEEGIESKPELVVPLVNYIAHPGKIITLLTFVYYSNTQMITYFKNYFLMCVYYSRAI